MKKTFKTLQVESELKEQIEYIAKITNQSQNAFLKSIIGKVFEIAAIFNEDYDVWYDVFEQVREQNITIQIFGRPKLIQGERKSLPSLTDNENDLIDERILQLDMDELARRTAKKTEKVKVTEKTGIKVEGEVKK